MDQKQLTDFWQRIVLFFSSSQAYLSSSGGTEIDFGIKGYGCVPVIHGYRANGTEAFPTGVIAGDMVLGIGSRTWDGDGFTDHSTSAIHIVALENHTSTAHGTDFGIYVTPVGSTNANRKLAVQYLASPSGIRSRMRLSGPDSGRLMFQTDEVGANTSMCAVPHGGMAANYQARDSHTPNFGRLFFEANSSSGNRIVSDSGGTGVVQPINVTVGPETNATFNTDGSTTVHKGLRLGATSPKLMAKTVAGTLPQQGQSLTLAHGIDASKVVGLHPITRQASGAAVPPGVSFAPTGVQYEARCDAQNIVLSMHPTNSASLVGAAVSVLVLYSM